MFILSLYPTGESVEIEGGLDVAIMFITTIIRLGHRWMVGFTISPACPADGLYRIMLIPIANADLGPE
jgi:hypothetical protein